MKIFYDLRLGYLVAAPGQDTPLTGLQGKAGDEEEVIIQFGRSSDPTSSISIIESPTWTAENLAGGTVITIGIKADGNYSDGDVLASSSSPTNDAGAFTYTFPLDLNTTEINTALARDDANSANDVATLDCQFECTFQIGGSGGWRSSVLEVPFTLYHDIISGSEATPTDAADPDEYLLKVSGIEWYPTVTSLTGGTAADLDAVPTVALAAGKIVAFLDTDPATDVVRYYLLAAGTDAESSPTIIRPDDYATTTNEKVWKLSSSVAGIADIVDDTTPQLGGVLDANSKQIREAKGADVASATALTLGSDGNYFDITGTTTVTSIATKAVGTRVTLRFAGILILTHHATDLILPTGANITTAAGDVATFIEYASGDWVCVNYQRASGSALASLGITDLVDDTTPQLGGTLDTNAKQVRESKGANVASAATLTLGTDGNYFDITGTTTITSIATLAVGTEVTLRFSGVLTLTHHSTDLILPGGVSITTASGDVAVMREYATADWRCISYSKASGLPVVSPASSAIPSSIVSIAAGFTGSLQVSDSGKILSCDTSSDVVTVTIDTGTYSAGHHFWIRREDVANSCTLTRGGSVAIWLDGTNGDHALNVDYTYHFYREATNEWRCLGYA